MDIPLHSALEGHTALVTGANRGIGARIAAGLADLGATVYAGARDPAQIAGVQDESGGQIRPVRLDVRDEEQVQAAVEHVVDDAGRLDVVVNNAGIGDWHGTVLHTIDTSMLDKVLATNLRGPMLLCKHALPHLLDATGDDAGPDGTAGAARIVNLSSGMGQFGGGMDLGRHGFSGSAPAYRVTKAGINALTAYLDGEYGMRGLIANSVCPGWVRTDMGGQNAPRPPEKGAETPVWLCRFKPGAPGGRFWRDRKVIEW